ncbi:hypothetical protein [Bradyrhizobium sp. BR 1432]|uniref:hypothetical protein n=1 Tax=Bradyrhizobium sp. BR 1432 TaxID=3447966 RepID=UPI003EE5B023
MRQITFYGKRDTDTSNLLQKTLAAVAKLRPNILLICRDAIGLDYSRRHGKSEPIDHLEIAPMRLSVRSGVDAGLRVP